MIRCAGTTASPVGRHPGRYAGRAPRAGRRVGPESARGDVGRGSGGGVWSAVYPSAGAARLSSGPCARRGGAGWPQGRGAPTRVRRDGHEVPLPSVHAFTHTDPLNRRSVEQMLVGVATRQYGRSLEPLGVDVRTRGTSKGAVSRRFVAQTQAQLDAWRAMPLDGLDLAVLLIDGVPVGGHCIVVALGIDTTGANPSAGALGRRHRECDGLSGAIDQSREPRTPHRPEPPSSRQTTSSAWPTWSPGSWPFSGTITRWLDHSSGPSPGATRPGCSPKLELQKPASIAA